MIETPCPGNCTSIVFSVEAAALSLHELALRLARHVAQLLVHCVAQASSSPTKPFPHLGYATAHRGRSSSMQVAVQLHERACDGQALSATVSKAMKTPLHTHSPL